MSGYNKLNYIKPYSNLKIALISDELTRNCLAEEVNIFNITPWNYQLGLKTWKPDLLLVESAWNGYLNSWKYKIASYPSESKNNHKLQKVIQYAQGLNIPCVFWNKEDNIHFDRFIKSASLFDNILTVDKNCIDEYKNSIKRNIKVESMMFAVQPSIHHFKDFKYANSKACFVGSYTNHEHDDRRKWQDLFFLSSSNFGLDIYDRHSNKISKNYQFPDIHNMSINKKVPHNKTGDIYRNYIVSLNINTVTSSETMFSRRLIEIIACGRTVISNPSKSINKHFNDYCKVVSNQDELEDVYHNLKNGYSKSDKERLVEGSEFIIKKHSYTNRISQILDFMNI